MHVINYNSPAIRFYEKHEFQKLRELEGMFFIPLGKFHDDPIFSANGTFNFSYICVKIFIKLTAGFIRRISTFTMSMDMDHHLCSLGTIL